MTAPKPPIAVEGRHRWGPPSRPSRFKTERQCARCGLVKVSRHEGDPGSGSGASHWTEWWRGLDRIESGATPRCEAAGAAADAKQEETA